MKSDIIVGLQHGDEGKGKVVLSLINDKYDYCLRFNGGPNAGHTVYVKGNKIVLHQIPCGIVNNKISIIVDKEPKEVGIDPYNKLIDTNSEDNRKKIEN